MSYDFFYEPPDSPNAGLEHLLLFLTNPQFRCYQVGSVIPAPLFRNREMAPPGWDGATCVVGLTNPGGWLVVTRHAQFTPSPAESGVVVWKITDFISAQRPQEWERLGFSLRSGETIPSPEVHYIDRWGYSLFSGRALGSPAGADHELYHHYDWLHQDVKGTHAPEQLSLSLF